MLPSTMRLPSHRLQHNTRREVGFVSRHDFEIRALSFYLCKDDESERATGLALEISDG